jgi:energy-coupling factor transporter ATP-binding protein EcfA2
MDSEILALDEPTDNLDPVASRRLIERIQTIPQTKMIVTHHLPVVADLCARAVLLRGGELVGDLPTEEFLKRPDLLEGFGFDPEFARWLLGRMKRAGGAGSGATHPHEG